MPLDAARWQIDLMAADKTASAFNSLNGRMKQAQQQAQATGGAMSVSMDALTKRLGAVGAAYLSIETAVNLFHRALKAGDIGEQAEQVGLTSDQLQAYRLAAAQAGITTEQLDTAMMRFTKSMGTANEGNDEMIARFDKLGVKLLDFQGKLRKPADVLPELARGLLAMGSETERNSMLMELFGRSGGRMVTVLGDLAGGNQALIDKAKAQNAVVGGETIKVWDDLGDSLKVAEVKMDTLIATLSKPVAMLWVANLNTLLTSAAFAMDKLRGAGAAVANVFTNNSSEDLVKRQETIKAMIDNIRDLTDAIDQAKLVGLKRDLQEINDTLAARANIFTMPPTAVTAAGVSQPAGNKGKGFGESAEKKLSELRAEHAALDRALAMFDVGSTDTVAQVDKRLTAQVALEKRIAELTVNLPKDSPLAKQLAAEARAITDGNAKLDERKRILTEAEGVSRQYGDGQREFTRQQADLNQMVAMGAISTDTYAFAMKRLTEQTDDQKRAAIGARGGVDGFIAGINQAMADMDRANTAFDLGRKTVGLLDDAIDALAGRANKSFDQIAGDFAVMLAKMAAQAAASEIFKGVGGVSGLLGLIGLGGDGMASGSTLAGLDAQASSNISLGGPLAEGGPIGAGDTHLVGEEGPELFTPRTSGRIIPNDELGGGSTTVIVHQTVNVGEFVTTNEYQRGLQATKQAAQEGAINGIIAMRRSGDSRIKKAFA